MKNVKKVGELVNFFFEHVETKKINQANVISQSWKDIAGIKAGNHSRILDIKKGILFIEVDHPGWIQILQLQRNEILSKMKNLYAELEIHSLGFILKEDNDVARKSEEIYAEQSSSINDSEDIEITEEKLKNKSIEEIPELKNIFDKLKKSMKYKH